MIIAAPIAVAGKIAQALAGTKAGKKASKWILIAVIAPFLIIIAVICGAVSTSQHNNQVLELCFFGGEIPSKIPAEYAEKIEQMRVYFALIDEEIARLESQMNPPNRLDAIRIKAVFFALFFESDLQGIPDIPTFVRCFVTSEEVTETVTDENGNPVERTKTIYTPIKNLEQVYQNIETGLGITVTEEQKATASAIYSIILYGKNTPDSDDDEGENGVNDNPDIFVGAGEFASPLGANWRSMVSSEFGWRNNPTGSGRQMHNGIDLAAPKGTPIQAARAGTVSVATSHSSYGNYIMIDHGDGMVTLYAHCSKLYAKKGQRVAIGEVIAGVGTTGNSTGNHLHFEVRISGKKVNPRQYLP